MTQHISLDYFGFGSCHCFGVAVASGAMASAKGEGENLFRLPCGGDSQASLSFTESSSSNSFISFLLSNTVQGNDYLSPWRKVNRWHYRTLLFRFGKFVGLHEGHCCQRLCFCSGALSKPRLVPRNQTRNEDKNLKLSLHRTIAESPYAIKVWRLGKSRT